MTRATSLLLRQYKLVASPRLPTLRSFKPAHIPNSRFNSGTAVSAKSSDHTTPFYYTPTGSILIFIACMVVNVSVWRHNSKLDAEIAIVRKRNADYEKIKEAVLKAEALRENESME